MRAELAAALLLAASALPARAEDDHGHGRPPVREVALNELTAEQRRRTLDAFAHVVCKCPSENWSKTLAMCPDACANPQKATVVRRVIEGRTLDEIVAEQVRLYGPKASAEPASGIDPAVGAGIAVVAAAVVAAVALMRRRPAAKPDGTETSPARAEQSAVERELREVE
ncbi:MAG: hypothetical protein HMLKMBBP_01714 [Planctomycetes bacterium]|nr:hypothetical protein [Planctomycetota bacterium]